MRLRESLRLVGLFASRDLRSAVSSTFGIAVGVFALVFFVALGLGVSRVLREKVFPVDVQLVEVVPSALSLGSLWGGGKLDEAAVSRLGQIPGVEAMYRKMSVRVPAVTRYDGTFFGARLRMGAEVLAMGVEPGFLEDASEWKVLPKPGEGALIPAVVSSRLLEIYNRSFAPARKLPVLSGEILKGFVFPVEFNRSYVAAGGEGSTWSVQAKVVAVSDRALLAGITVPLEIAREINRRFQVDAETYSAVTLKAQGPDDVPRIIQAVKDMGLEVDEGDRRLAGKAGWAVALVTAALAFLASLICALSAVNIAHALMAAMRARAKDIGILRAVGASRSDIRHLVLLEAGFLGLVGGGLGTLLAFGAALALDAGARVFLPPFPFQPESFFQFPMLLWPAGTGVGLVAAWLGALSPARWISKQEPAQVLAG